MCGNDSWEKIKRNYPFLAITVTINIEGDADTSEEFFGLNRLLAQFPEVLIFNPGKQLRYGWRPVPPVQPNASSNMV